MHNMPFQQHSTTKAAFIASLIFIALNSATGQETPHRALPSDPTPLHAITMSDGCEAYVTLAGDPATIKSKDILLVKRPKYQYWLQIEKKAAITTAHLRSMNGEKFQLGDELMAFNASNKKLHFKYSDISGDGLTASFALDENSIQQMAAVPLEYLILKSTTSNKILKLEVENNSKDLLKRTMECF
jgi:hypothetical protein